MATKEAKKHCGRIGGNETNTVGVDRISELPDPLIYHILSFLPTFYVVRMSILSKRWRRMWISVPVLYFEEFQDVTFKNMVKSQRNMFFKFVSNCLRRRRLSMQFSGDTFITRFKLDMQYHFGGSTSDNKIDDWLSFAVQCNVKELDLCMKPSRQIYYCLPEFVLNASSLASMSLSDLELEAYFSVSLPSLRTLSLGNYSGDHFDNKALQNLISGCPVIESFHLVSTCSLCKLDLAVSGTLKEIYLSKVKITEQWLADLITRLPLLEKLCLFLCSGLKIIRIHSDSLRVFRVKVGRRITVLFRTPNLVCFDYVGGAESIFSIDAPNLLEAYMEIKDRNNFSRSWYFYLMMLLSNLNCLKKLTLYVSSEQVLTIPAFVRKICHQPLPDLKHLKVKISEALSEDSKLRKAMLWCAPKVEILEIEQIKTNSS